MNLLDRAFTPKELADLPIGLYRTWLGAARKLRRRGRAESVHPRRMKITRSRADAKWATAVKDQKHHTCQRCGAREPFAAMEAAHILSRRHKATRLLQENGLCLCAPCHRWAHDHPREFEVFVVQLIGQRAYDKLRILAWASR